MHNTRRSIMDIINQTIFLTNHPLTTRLFVFSAILVIIPLFIVGIISYQRSSVVLEDEARVYSWQVMDQVKTHMEYYMRDVEITSLKIINDPDMVAFLRMQTPEEVENSNIRSSVENLLKMSAYSRPDISDITIIVDGVRVISSLGSASPYPAHELSKEYWYALVPAYGTPLLISRYIQWPDRKEPVISLVKRIYSPHTLQPIGMLIIDVNFRRIQEISDKFDLRNGYFAILDGEGYYVYHPDHSLVGKKAFLSNIEQIFSQREGAFIQEERDFITYIHSDFLGWRFVSSIPYSDLRRGAAYLGQAIAGTTLITLVVAYVLGIGFASTLVRPIRRLQRLMKNVEVGDFSEKVTVESSDEIGQLSRGFNKMVDRLAGLIEEVYCAKIRETEASLRQREMELKVLQSQVNPHFLCNSLETIRGMALAEGNEDIATMASSLGTLLRYNLRNSLPTVSLREELRYCEVYLRIQQYRFDRSFQYSLEIPEWAWNLNILKFSLQPLVENCFVHGLGINEQQLSITIRVLQDSEHSVVIEVADDGLGIEPEVLARIRQDLAEKTMAEEGTRIGIVNVHRRIVHLFGETYGLTVNSKLGEGTTINIRMPAVYGGEEDKHENSVACR